MVQLKEFTPEDWQEVCERMNQFTSLHECSAYINELKKVYMFEPLYEMAKNRSSFITFCIGESRVIHNTICNIICLSDEICPEALLHWRHELILHGSNLVNEKIEKSVKRLDIVIDRVMDSVMDSYKDLYTYDDEYVYEIAMKDEIRKSKISTATNPQKISGKQIEKYIMPNLHKFVEPNKERIYKLFKSLVEAINHKDYNIWKLGVDDFINTEVIVNI